jgi:hypothetical protein
MRGAFFCPSCVRRLESVVGFVRPRCPTCGGPVELNAEVWLVFGTVLYLLSMGEWLPFGILFWIIGTVRLVRQLSIFVRAYRRSRA